MVCPQCLTVETLPKGKVYKTESMYEDMSPLKIGAQGKYQQKAFNIVGRVKYKFTSGYKNHWIAAWPDESIFIIDEAYGHFTFFKEENIKLPNLEKIKAKPGAMFKPVNRDRFMVEAFNQCTGFIAEGELPALKIFPFAPFVEIIASSSEKTILNIHLFGPNTAIVYSGMSVPFADMNLKLHREVHGWS